MKPPIVKPRAPWTVGPLIPHPDSLSPAVDPTTTTRPSFRQSTATDTFIQPVRAKTQSSGQDSLQATTSTLPSLSLNKTTSIFEGSTDMPEGSGDLPEESGDMPEESGDMP